MLTSQTIDRLAASMHENYLREAVANRWPVKAEVNKPFEQLSPEYQESNRAAARRIGEVLAVIGVRIVPPREAQMRALSEVELYDLVQQNMKQLAPAEHEGWMREKIAADWRFGPQRDDARKLHPSLVPFAQLSGEDKEKDRNQVRTYPALLAQAGLVAVRD